MSSVPNRIPELDVNKDKDTKTIYGLYSICMYDDGRQDNQFCITLDDTLDDDKLSDKIQTMLDKHTLHCKANKAFTPYTLVIRKVKISIETDAIETCTKHFIPEFKLHNPICENCGEVIKYGDGVYIYNEKKFCSPECITEHLKVRCIERNEDGYNDIFNCN